MWKSGNVEILRTSDFHISTFPDFQIALYAFSRQPISDLLARPDMIVVQVDEHGSERQSLRTTFMRAAFRDLVETSEQSLEMIRNQLAVTRQVVHRIVNRAERARPAVIVEIAAETLRTALRTGADVIRQFLLFALEFSYHLYPPAAKRLIVAHPSMINDDPAD